jgi:pimeloyl-ACP methyl ester carboxylesterase
MITDTSFGPVHWQQIGEGRTMILLSANPGDIRDWDGVIAALALEYRVIAIDWPGHGQSPAPQPANAASVMMFADVLAELVEQWNIEGAIVVGNSVGGYAAIRLAVAAPNRVAALVLINSGGFTQHTLVTRAFCALKGREWVTKLVCHFFAKRYLPRRTPWSNAMLERAAFERKNPQQVAVDAAVWRSFTNPQSNLAEVAKQVTQPTMLIWGKQDPVLPINRDGKHARAALSHASWVELDVGHAAFAEDPDAFLAAVQPFLRAQRKPIA